MLEVSVVPFLCHVIVGEGLASNVQLTLYVLPVSNIVPDEAIARIASGSRQLHDYT